MRLIAFLLLMTALVFPQVAKADSIASDFPIGSSFENTLHISKIDVPLPPGKWVVTALDESLNNNNAVTAALTLVNIIDGKLQKYISISTNVDMGSQGWQPHSFCSRKDVYFLRVDSNYPKEQACWGVNHLIMDPTSSYTPKYGLNIRKSLMEKGIKMPRTLISTLFRFADSYKYVSYEIMDNPESRGFPPTNDGNWASSPWHKDLIAGNKDRVKFLEEVKTSYSPFFEFIRKQF